MINDKREKNDKEKITIKFLLANNNYNYIMIKEKNDKEKIIIKFLRSNNNYHYIINDKREKMIKKK